MQYTISARQLQREYKKVLEEANKIGKPLIVVANNKPQAAIIGLDLLERLQFQTSLTREGYLKKLAGIKGVWSLKKEYKKIREELKKRDKRLTL